MVLCLSLVITKHGGHIYATTIENHKPNTLLISTAKRFNNWKKLLDNYKYGNVYFENQKIKNSAMEVLKMFLR